MKFQADADFEANSAVASYFFDVFLKLVRANILVVFFLCFFWGRRKQKRRSHINDENGLGPKTTCGTAHRSVEPHTGLWNPKQVCRTTNRLIIVGLICECFEV